MHNDWHNIIKRQSIHVGRKYHKDAIKDSYNLINRFEKAEGIIDYDSYTAYRERCTKYPNILAIRAVHFHGRQGLALRGHRGQESDENQNMGNFLTYLEELQNYCLS